LLNRPENDDDLILIENTIRWRYSQENLPESNARMVRWSNGTFSLLIGEELFDVNTSDISDRYHFLTTQFPTDGFLKTQARYTRYNWLGFDRQCPSLHILLNRLHIGI
jgi:RNA polymerase-associated protein LEO1